MTDRIETLAPEVRKKLDKIEEMLSKATQGFLFESEDGVKSQRIAAYTKLLEHAPQIKSFYIHDADTIFVQMLPDSEFIELKITITQEGVEFPDAE